MELVAPRLTREEVIRVIERKGAAKRPPLLWSKWWGEGLREQYGSRLSQFDKYSDDVVTIPMPQPSCEPCANGFCWKLRPARNEKTGYDAQVRLEWDDLEEMLDNPPDLSSDEIWEPVVKAAEYARANGYYMAMHHWGLMFEKIWGFRGMENLLADYYEEPEKVHQLHRLVCDTELKIVKKEIELVHPDGYIFSDDLGSQQSLLMSPACFREFIKPYYTELWSYTHQNGIHNWLHTCGCVREIIGDLIECGLDVLHPIQKHTMDWDEIAGQWKGKITFLAGMDVQQLLIHGTTEEVREEVRLIKRTFGSPAGGLLIAAGNGIVGGTPLENIDAFLDECVRPE